MTALLVLIAPSGEVGQETLSSTGTNGYVSSWGALQTGCPERRV